MWTTGRRYRAIGLVLAFLVGLSIVQSVIEQPGPAAAVGDTEGGDRQDSAEHRHDLELAEQAGGTSPNRLIVVYAQAVPLSHPDPARVRQRAGGQLLRGDVALQQDVIRLAGDDAAAVAREVRAYPGVLDALPDYVVRADLVVDDPRLGEAYGLAKIEAPASWDVAQG